MTWHEMSADCRMAFALYIFLNKIVVRSFLSITWNP